MANCTSADSILEAAALIKTNGKKIDKFTNGTASETVQLGMGDPTPTLRKLVQDVYDSDSYVHKTGTETITGAKAFTQSIDGNLNGTAAMAVADGEGRSIVQTYANKDILHLVDPRNWEQIGLYPHVALQNSGESIYASQGFCFDSKRNRFVVGMINDGNTYQELHAFAFGDFSAPVLVTAHSDLGHVNSMAYCSETDEIVCMTTLSDSATRKVGIIDPGTLTTKKILSIPLSAWPNEFHLAYDLVEQKFVMARQYTVSGDTYPTKEHVWVCSAVVTNGSLDGFSIDKDFYLSIGLVNGEAAGQSNGLGANGGMMIYGGNYIGIADYKKEEFYGFGYVNPSIAEVEDFCFAHGSWFVNVNKVYGIFKCSSINAKYNLSDYSYVPTHGGTVYGSLAFPSSTSMPALKSSFANANGAIRLWGGPTANEGSSLLLIGKNFGDSSSGSFIIRVRNAADTADISLQGKPDGSLTWNGADITGNMHLAGEETVTGVKRFKQDCLVLNSTSGHASVKTVGDGVPLRAFGGITQNKSSKLVLIPSDFSTSDAGGFVLYTADGTAAGTPSLKGLPTGSLTWNGQTIQTSSDERLKTPLSSVPDNVLDAWEAVQWGQFQFLDAVESKGENARLHLGLIAQKVKSVFEARGLDACKYGILCHEEHPATEDGPAVDLWMVRYTEALAMETACLRRRIARLEERLNG